MSVLCNRSAIEIRRYGRPMGFPTTPKLMLIAGVCGRGMINHIFIYMYMYVLVT